MVPPFGPLIQHQNKQFVKYHSGTLDAVENPLPVLLWSSPVTLSYVTLSGEVHPWALILTLLRVELPKPAVSAPVLPCKHLLLGKPWLLVLWCCFGSGRAFDLPCPPP